MTTTNIFSLSDELLAHICSYAMIWRQPTVTSTSQGAYLAAPNGVITEQISKRLRHLLQPFRCCRRLYRLAKHAYLESNVIVLNLADIRGSASRLEFTSGTTQMIMTGNPDPLLKNLVRVELVVSISDMRAPFSQPFASSSSRRLWKSGSDVLSLNKEAENLKRLTMLCPSLRTLHIFLKVDEWVLYGKGPELRLVEGLVRNEAGMRYRRLAEGMIELLNDVKVRRVSVGFGHWRSEANVMRMDGRGAGEVLDACLMESVRETLAGPVVRVR